MLRSVFLTVAISVAVLSIPAAARSQSLPSEREQAPSLTHKQVRLACARNQAEALPNPFSDVSPDHWAYRAVLSLFYCGPTAGRPLDAIPSPPPSEG